MSNVISLDQRYADKEAAVIEKRQQAIEKFIASLAEMINDPDEPLAEGIKIIAATWGETLKEPRNLIHLASYTPTMYENIDDGLSFNQMYREDCLDDNGKWPLLNSIVLESGTFELPPESSGSGRALFNDAFARHPLPKACLPGDPIFAALYLTENTFGYKFQRLVTRSDEIQVIFVSPTIKVTLTVYPEYYHDIYLRGRRAADQLERIGPDREPRDWSEYDPK